MCNDDKGELSVSDWLTLLKKGHHEAFELLWQRYHQRLVGLAREAVKHGPSRHADEYDVVQSALASFFFNVQDGRYAELNDRIGLWKLLITITLSKAHAMNRKEGRRLEILAREAMKGSFPLPALSPELTAEFADQVCMLLEKLPDDVLKSVAAAKLEGFSNSEIAEQLGKSVTTVERKLRLIRDLWTSESFPVE